MNLEDEPIRQEEQAAESSVLPKEKGRNRFLNRILHGKTNYPKILYSVSAGLTVGMIGFIVLGSLENTVVRNTEAVAALPAPYSDTERDQANKIKTNFNADYDKYNRDYRFDLVRVLVADNSPRMVERIQADDVLDAVKANNDARDDYAFYHRRLSKVNIPVYLTTAGLIIVSWVGSAIVLNRKPEQKITVFSPAAT